MQESMKKSEQNLAFFHDRFAVGPLRCKTALL